ncbi:MAG: helix-turn-helix domain-containing protein [Deltaproteobacteria bacterium]|nr:helix-turn-helix domain-containing protein [Deltaproteobacteria bacterium]
MTPSQNKTLYELLDVAVDASPYEIRRAYEDAHEVYAHESMGSYSFFTETERKMILTELESAYLILIDSRSRSDYDKKLISQGRMDEGRQYQDKTKIPIPLYMFKREHAAPSPTIHADSDAVEDPSLQAMLHGETLTGADLKIIRGKKGISLDHIFFQSRVSMAALQAIEEDRFDLLPPRVYVKSFLKSYAQALNIDPDHLAQAYLKHMDECEGTPL